MIPAPVPHEAASMVKIPDMTAAEKQSEVMRRLNRLGEIRGELSVRKSNLREHLIRVAAAGKKADNILKLVSKPVFDTGVDRWPSFEEVLETVSSMSELRNEADQLIGELRDLGVDDGLLAINGK